MKKVIISIVLLVAVLGGAFFFWQQKKNTTAPSSQIENSDIANNQESEEVLSVRPEFPKEWESDQDQDGLTNEEELKFNTSDVEVDTDGDGISDVSEVTKWKTDPTKVDSDGDGFSDMVEIRGGYNPNGEGKLLR